MVKTHGDLNVAKYTLYTLSLLNLESGNLYTNDLCGLKAWLDAQNHTAVNPPPALPALTAPTVRLPLSKSLPAKQLSEVEAIKMLMEEKDENGKFIFKTKSQWIAVYRILVDYRKWREDYHGFSGEINKLGVFRVPCKENAIKRIDRPFDKPFCTWADARYAHGVSFDRQHRVALRLAELLNITV
jgi:hypothetical protein